MNKKVLTLCAGFLLAGSLANAQEAHWVKVEDPTLMLFNKAYLISNLAGDSILSQKASNYQQAYLIEKNAEDAAITEAFYLNGKASQFNILASQDKNGNALYANSLTGDYYFNVAKSTSKISVDENGNINITYSKNGNNNAEVKGNYYLVRKEGGDITGVAEANDYTKYAFWMQTTSPETADDAFEVAQTLYLMSDGKYIIVNEEGKIESTETAPSTDKLNAVWVVKGEGLYNVGAKKYLTWASNKFNLSETEVSFALNGPVAVINGKAVAEASLTQTNTPLPIETYFNPADLNDNKTVVLYTTYGTVISADGSIENYYVANDAVETVWTLTPVAIGSAVGDAQQYEVRLTNPEVEGNNHYLVINEQIVTVEGINVDKDGNMTLPADGKIVLKAGYDYVTLGTNGLDVTPVKGQAYEFGLGTIEIAHIQAQYLLKDRFGDHFTLGITYTDTKGTPTTNDDVDYDLTSIFEGKLVPTASVDYAAGEADYHAAQPGATEFMLVNEDGDILAVNTDEDARLSEGASNHVYPLTTISPRQWEVDQDATGDKIYATKFRFEYVPGTDASEVEKITKIEALVNGSWVSLGCYLDKTVPTLVAASGNVALKEISIKLNAGSIVDPQAWLTQPVYYKVTVKNTDKDAAHYGEILGLDQNGDIAYVAKAKTDQTKPEGQFAIYYEDKDNDGVIEYTFTNRETGRATNVYKADYTLKGDRLYKIDDTTFAYLHGGHMDTLAIEPIKTFTSADGFDRFTADQLNGNTYNVAMNLLDETYLYTVENHNDRHRVGLDREDATDWRIAMSTVKVLDAASDEIAVVPDTVTIAVPIHYYANSTDKWVSTLGNEGKKAKYNNPNTALKVPTYVLLNTATDEYLNGKNYDEETGNAYYVCNEDEETATRVAFKQVGDSTVNLVPVGVKVNYYPYKDTDNWVEDMSVKTENAYKTYAASLCLLDNKIIGGTTSATGVLHDEDLYHATNNDLFRITETGARTYKLLEQGDNIIISLEENNDNVLYEDGEFAGIDNRLAYEINPALYVDTAYVNRVGNYRYEYLLGVNINRVDTLDDCNNPNHDHLRTVFTEGRFLVNMRDSMEAEAEENVHANKYAYDNEPKLAFVPGYHQNDTLYLMNEAGEVISKSFIGNSAPHFAKFSFKMINEENNEFIVEVGNTAAEQIIKNEQGNWTIIKTEPTRGYLRWHNDNLVVTRNIDNAAHFTMEDTDLIATSNEEIIAAEGAISVTATDGAVIIKGAEGKNVVIATILGKVVANETINSDNETIAVPAGIAVVSVDGESFKVVVK